MRPFPLTEMSARKERPPSSRDVTRSMPGISYLARACSGVSRMRRNVAFCPKRDDGYHSFFFVFSVVVWMRCSVMLSYFPVAPTASIRHLNGPCMVATVVDTTMALRVKSPFDEPCGLTCIRTSAPLIFTDGPEDE